MNILEDTNSGVIVEKRKLPMAHAIPLSNYDYTSANLIIALTSTNILVDDSQEVTHEVFFGENINRVKSIFKK